MEVTVFFCWEKNRFHITRQGIGYNAGDNDTDRGNDLFDCPVDGQKKRFHITAHGVGYNVSDNDADQGNGRFLSPVGR